MDTENLTELKHSLGKSIRLFNTEDKQYIIVTEKNAQNEDRMIGLLADEISNSHVDFKGIESVAHFINDYKLGKKNAAASQRRFLLEDIGANDEEPATLKQIAFDQAIIPVLLEAQRLGKINAQGLIK